MKFNSQDKDKFPKAFDAIKWLIKNSKEWENKTENDTEWGKVTTVSKNFEGNLPWYMVSELNQLQKVGYKNPTSSTGNLYWETSNAEYYVCWEFGQYRSNQNRINFSYTIFKYHDGLPERVA